MMTEPIWKKVTGSVDMALVAQYEKMNLDSDDEDNECKRMCKRTRRKKKAAYDFQLLMAKHPPPEILGTSHISTIKLEKEIEKWLRECKSSATENKSTINEQLELLDAVYDLLVKEMEGLGHILPKIPLNLTNNITLDVSIYPFFKIASESVMEDMKTHPEWF